LRDEGNNPKQEVVSKGKSQAAFPFAVDPFGSADNEVDSGVVEADIAEAAANVHGAQCGYIPLKRRGSDFGGEGGDPARNGCDRGGIRGMSPSTKGFVGPTDAGVTLGGGGGEGESKEVISCLGKMESLTTGLRRCRRARASF